MQYLATDYRVSINKDEYFGRFQDRPKFINYCRECHNYNRLWVCPPFDFDIDEQLDNYRHVLLIATKITPLEKGIPIARAIDFIRPERERIERMLLEMENKYQGRSFAFAGSCLYCPEDTCTRLVGLPCRHPDMARPSLEAYGFDIGRTTTELFDIELLWGKNGFLPDYLVIVSGFFHNSSELQ